jgi:hypothetical protein
MAEISSCEISTPGKKSEDLACGDRYFDLKLIFLTIQHLQDEGTHEQSTNPNVGSHSCIKPPVACNSQNSLKHKCGQRFGQNQITPHTKKPVGISRSQYALTSIVDAKLPSFPAPHPEIVLGT